MKPQTKGLYSSIFLAVLASSAVTANAAITRPMPMTPGMFYAGIFAGGGSTNSIDVSQFGSAYFTEEEGGPLAVNAFGDTNNHSSWLFGVQVGYQAPQICLQNLTWSITPAAELEGYYLGSTSYHGDLINNTARLPEHDFDVSFSMRRTVFLANAVLNFNFPCSSFHPYVGAGFGGAIVRLSGADSTQVSPPEVGINHFNASTSDTSPTFAGQLKAGLSYDITPCVNVFAEYRWLYLANTHFTFGSTVYPTHAETSDWQFKMNNQSTNLGDIGIRVKW